MTGILTECTKPIWEKLLNSGIAEARYVCCFQCIVEDFESEKKNLKAIQDDPSSQQKHVNDLINEDTEIKNCFFGWCPNCAGQYRKGKELAYKTNEIRRLKESNPTTDLTRILDVDYHSSHNYIPFKSRVTKYKELVDELKDESNYVIGLYGMGGTGKTTLVKEVGKELKKMKQFDLVIDATVSNTPDIKRIQEEIAAPMGLNLKERGEVERHKLLHQSLINSKKTLLILDDVWDWEHIRFEKIGIPDNHKGCRVLLTTRNLRVCQSMNCQRIIKLETLSDRDSWNMFKLYASISDKSNLKDKGQKITKECKGLPVAIAAIARSLRGQGQPEWDAALKTLQALRYDDVDENKIDIYKCLKYSYDNLKSKQEKELFLVCASFEEDREIPFSALTRYSIGVGLFKETDKYETSRSQVVIATKKLIDSCLLLPAGIERVKMHDLVREVALWIADNKTLVVDLSDKKQKELVEREKNIRYLRCVSKDTDIFSCLFDGTNLEILVVDFYSTSESVKVPDAFIEKVPSLRVLVFGNVDWGSLALSLPQSIQLSKCIRSIFLEDWELGDISILGMIQCLETLDLCGCSIKEFPTKMIELEKFKLLRLQGCRIEMNNPFEVIERCSSLEELYFIENKVLWVDNVDKAKLIHQVRNFPKFQRYHLMDWYERLDYSEAKCVFVKDIDALISKETCKQMMQSAEILQIRESKLARRNLVPKVLSIENQGMQDLVKLGLYSCSKVQCLVDTTEHIISGSQSTFSKLVELQLQSMDNLEEICNGPLPFNLVNKLERLYIKHCWKLQGILIKSTLNLCNLKIMEVINCPMLASLFHLSTAQSLVVLEALKIHGCGRLTNIITNDKIGDQNKGQIFDYDGDLKNRSSMFPKLKTLDIRKCHLLEFILPVFSTQDILALEAIKINDCGKLKYIFGQYNQDQKDQYLHQEVNDVIIASVKRMELINLPNFSDIFPKYDHSMSSTIMESFSKCASKEPKQWSYVKCNIFSWTTHKCSYAQKCGHKWRCNKDKKQDCSTSSMRYPKNPFTLRNLEVVMIEGCEKLESIFSSSILRCLPQLEVLWIESCIELEQLIDEDEGKQKSSPPSRPCFPKLRALFVIQCNKLKRLFSISKSEEFPQLEILFIKEASELEEAFGCEQSVKKVELPKLKHVVFINLPSLCQGIDLRSGTHHVVHNCPKLHNSPPTRNVDINELVEQMCDILRDTSYGSSYVWGDELRKLVSEAITQDTSTHNRTTESTSDSENGSETAEASGRDSPFQQELLDEDSLGEKYLIKDQQQVRETEANSTRISEGNNFLKEAEDQSIQEVARSENNVKETTPVVLAETRNTSSEPLLVAPLQRNNDRNVEEDGTTTKNVKEVTSIPHSIPTCSPSGPLITSQHKTSQLENVVAPNHPTTKDGDGKDPHKAFEFVAGPAETHSPESTSYSENGSEAEAVSGRDSLFQQGLLDGDSLGEQYLIKDQLQVRETEAKSTGISEGNNFLKEAEDQSIQEVAKLETNVKETTSIDPAETRNTSSEPLRVAPLQKNNDRNVEDGTAAKNVKEVTSIPHSIPTCSPSSPLINSQHKAYQLEDVVSPNHSTTKDGDGKDSHNAFEFVAGLTKTHPPGVMEDPNLIALITMELEELVASSHLASENLSLLTDFITKNPSVRLTDNSHSNKYKGFAYSCLADLLRFLQTHSALDVLGSCGSDFSGLLHDVRSFGFDKDWLDAVERRALCPGLEGASQGQLQKSLDTKHQASKEVEAMRLRIGTLTQQVEDLKHHLVPFAAALESIIQQEAQVLKALSAPLGY